MFEAHYYEDGKYITDVRVYGMLRNPTMPSNIAVIIFDHANGDWVETDLNNIHPVINNNKE